MVNLYAHPDHLTAEARSAEAQMRFPVEDVIVMVPWKTLVYGHHSEHDLAAAHIKGMACDP
jgi:hypothetical protein